MSKGLIWRVERIRDEEMVVLWAVSVTKTQADYNLNCRKVG